MKDSKTEKDAARRDYPGAAIDAADADKTTEATERERTRTLNNNAQWTDIEGGVDTEIPK